MGNHDNQAALRRFVLDEAPSMAPLDRVRMIDGLRIITVDTSVSGFSHGDISTPSPVRVLSNKPGPHVPG
jgi:Icc protein